MSKLLFLDVESTGLFKRKNDVIQVGAIIEIDNFVEAKFVYNMQPFNWKNISEEAIKTHGITVEMMKKFPDPKKTKDIIQGTFDNYINKFDKKDKFKVVGYNVKFDIDFMYNYWKKCGDDYFFSYCDSYPIDVYQAVSFLHEVGIVPDLENYKLGTLCEHYNIPLKAHDAMDDIIATRKLYQILRKEVLKGGKR